MSLTAVLYLTALLVTAQILYVYTARWFGWFDLPNVRSMHQNNTTIRGAGLIIYVAVLCITGLGVFNQPLFLAGLTAVTLISFWDDIRAVSVRYRLIMHGLGVGLLLWQTGWFPGYEWVCVAWLVAGVGVLNSFNFMDGVNGMTALYGIVTVCTLWYMQDPETAPALFPASVIALLIFGYGNVRQRAIWFAGDVGSIAIGFISLYGLLLTINRYQTYLPLLFLAVYGVDTVLTVLRRLWTGQNVFRAHRLHLFQLLVHQSVWSHWRVSGLYALTQLGINALVFRAMDWSMTGQFVLATGVLGGLVMGYFLMIRRLVSAQKKVGLGES